MVYLQKPPGGRFATIEELEDYIDDATTEENEEVVVNE
jgi:hypothetical protein